MKMRIYLVSCLLFYGVAFSCECIDFGQCSKSCEDKKAIFDGAMKELIEGKSWGKAYDEFEKKVVECTEIVKEPCEGDLNEIYRMRDRMDIAKQVNECIKEPNPQKKAELEEWKGWYGSLDDKVIQIALDWKEPSILEAVKSDYRVSVKEDVTVIKDPKVFIMTIEPTETSEVVSETTPKPWGN